MLSPVLQRQNTTAKLQIDMIASSTTVTHGVGGHPRMLPDVNAGWAQGGHRFTVTSSGPPTRRLRRYNRVSTCTTGAPAARMRDTAVWRGPGECAWEATPAPLNTQNAGLVRHGFNDTPSARDIQLVKYKRYSIGKCGVTT